MKPRKKKTEVQKLKLKLWELCKQIIRKRDGNRCVVCGKQGLEGSGWHTGHFIASSVCGAFLRYDIRNLHSSCYYCNVNLGGNGAVFHESLERDYGLPFVKQIMVNRHVIMKADKHFYQRKIDEYTKLVELEDFELVEITQNYAETNPEAILL